MPIKLVLLDIEGVITDARGGEYPLSLPDAAQVERLLTGAAYGCALCSGRQVPFGEAIIVMLNLYKPLPEDIQKTIRSKSGFVFKGWPSILENGAYFWDPLSKQGIIHPLITADVVEQLSRVRATLTPFAQETKSHVEPGKDYCISINPPLVSEGSRERVSTDVFGPQVAQAIQKYTDVLEIKWSRSAVDITPKGVSKASAVQLLVEWSGLQPEEILGVGDSTGDKEWLQIVGRKAAPSNGKPYLENMDFYAQKESLEGLAQILEWAQD